MCELLLAKSAIEECEVVNSSTEYKWNKIKEDNIRNAVIFLSYIVMIVYILRKKKSEFMEFWEMPFRIRAFFLMRTEFN